MSSPGFLVAKASLAAKGGTKERPMPEWLADLAGLSARFSAAPPALPAALPTDGSATNAAMATAINAIRSVLIANGLGT